MAKVIGSLASGKPEHGKTVSGVLLKRGFNYHITAPSDLHNYTDLSTSSISQRQIIGFKSPFAVLAESLKHLCGKVESFMSNGMTAIRLFDGAVEVLQENRGNVIIEWNSNPLNDMYADATLTAVLNCEANPNKVSEQNRAMEKSTSKLSGNFHEMLLQLLNEKYGVQNVIESEEGDIVTVDVEGTVAVIDLETLRVDCVDEALRHLVSSVVSNLSQAMTPLVT